jgi:hypothetical protein
MSISGCVLDVEVQVPDCVRFFKCQMLPGKVLTSYDDFDSFLVILTDLQSRCEHS